MRQAGMGCVMIGRWRSEAYVEFVEQMCVGDSERTESYVKAVVKRSCTYM